MKEAAGEFSYTVREQSFDTIVNALMPSIRKICTKNRFLGCIDRDDLIQEALISLWKRFACGQLRDKTISYVLKGCYFHIQNYIRTHKVRCDIKSLDEPIAREGPDIIYLKDIIPDTVESPLQRLNCKLIVDDLMHNGLRSREKEVVSLLYNGLTLREAAEALGISHVRVFKIKQAICSRYKDKFFDTSSAAR